MRYLRYYMKISFSEIVIKKIILFLVFGGIFILSTAGHAGFDPQKTFSNNTNLFGKPNLTRMGYNVDYPLAVEEAIFGQPKENNIYDYFQNDTILSDEGAIDSEHVAQQILEHALTLCQLSQEYWQSGELNKAIELLDQAYLLILGINKDESDYLIQQKEDLRFMISKRIIEIHASRQIVIKGCQNEIPININKQVQHEIDLYTKGHLRNHFIASYKRSGKYRQMIVDMLKAKDLPQELSWLPLIESGFKAKALSKARALGLWQFIPSTGYKFGLSRNQYIDERLDPLKSTQAAINYLKELHSHFGDWSTVLAAYNCGETRVLRVIRNQKIRYLDNFWDLYEHLLRETARYVPKFIATLHIVNNPAKYGLDKITIDAPLKSESLTVTQKVHLKNAAKITGIDRKILEELNPELRQHIIPSGKYALKIPMGSKQILLANIDQILRLNPARVDFVKHRVRSGETLSLIAHRYRTSVADIMLANNLPRANYIVSGNTLRIPCKIKPSAQPKIGS
jgi:membrane-bound lytic murein transglycosylase D